MSYLSVHWYKEKLEYAIKCVMFRCQSSFSANSIIIEDHLFHTRRTLDELSTVYGIPLGLWNNCMIDAIGLFLNRYLKNDREHASRFFVNTTPLSYSSAQDSLAQQIVSICHQTRWRHQSVERQQSSINEIKRLLNLVVRNASLYPEDDMPKLAKAIFDSTKGAHGWGVPSDMCEWFNSNREWLNPTCTQTNSNYTYCY